jgi:hypothetical protein
MIFHMHVKRRLVETSLMLALWVLVGPLAMAFGPCAAMGMPCEGTCSAATPSPTERVDTASLMPLVAAVADPAVEEPSSPSLRIPEPPPKFQFASS